MDPGASIADGMATLRREVAAGPWRFLTLGVLAMGLGGVGLPLLLIGFMALDGAASIFAWIVVCGLVGVWVAVRMVGRSSADRRRHVGSLAILLVSVAASMFIAREVETNVVWVILGAAFAAFAVLRVGRDVLAKRRLRAHGSL